MTYIPLVFIQPIFISPPASVEEDCRTNVLSFLGLCGSLLDEGSERRDASAWANHDDGFGGVGREFKV